MSVNSDYPRWDRFKMFLRNKQDQVGSLEAVERWGNNLPGIGPWINIKDSQLQNSWVRWGDPNDPCRYRREFTDIVRIEMLIKNGTLGATIFNMPIGFRPPTNWRLVGVQGNGTPIETFVLSNGNISTGTGGVSNFFFWVAGTYTISPLT